MRKITIALVTVAALSVASGVVLTAPETGNTVQAAQTRTVTVSFVDKSTGKLLSSRQIQSDSSYYITIPESYLPSGYGFSSSPNFTSNGVYIASSTEATVFVSPITSYKANLVDSANGEVVKQITVNLLKSSGTLDLAQLEEKIPDGYSPDMLLGEYISANVLSQSGTNNIYVSHTGADKVKFVNVQNGATVGTGIFSNGTSSYATTPGYKSLIYIHNGLSSPDDYAKYSSIADGVTTIQVRPDYANKTVSAQFTDNSGKVIGSGTITFNASERISAISAPTGYVSYSMEVPESQLESGKFSVPANKKENTNTTHDGNSTPSDNSSSTSALQSQYNDLLAKYNALNTSDVASLAKELASLKSQMATMQAEIAALQHGSKSSSTKQLPIAGTVTVSGTKATVYNSKFAKTGRKLNVNSKWKVFGIVVTSNGHAYFNVGGGQYIPVSAAKLHATATKGKADTSIPVKTTITIKYKPGYSVQVWGKKFANFAKNADGSNKKLKHGTSWKVFAIVKHNGHLYYDLGGAQYLDSAYATLK